MAIRKRTFVRAIVVGSLVVLALILAVSAALAHTFLSIDPSQVGAISCVHTATDNSLCSNDVFACDFGNGCTRVFQETHGGPECGNGDGNGWKVLSESLDCGGPAPAVFLADVCEPNNGFSGDGWQTWDSDAVGTSLYYGASAEGPWLGLAINGPQWVLDETSLNAMAANAGAASYDDLWFKANERGYPVNVGDTIRNRAAKMDALCGG